jgi:transcriptional regulator with XRE-family HTH domain
VGLPAGARRRVPGLRRSELAALAGISVEYLVRIEQGRDRSPSVSVVNALADALRLDITERWHLRHLAKQSSGTCLGTPAQARLDVRPTVRALLDQLEPGIALVTNRLGDVLAFTSGFELLARPIGLLDAPQPNLTRFAFTDDRARKAFPDWAHIADERAFDLFLAPAEQSERLVAELAAAAGAEFTRRLHGHDLPPGDTQRWSVPAVDELRLEREVLELPAADAQQVVVYLPADQTTADALNRLRRNASGTLRAVN